MKEKNVKTIKIKGDYITLGQFLKLTDFASSGGEVKHLLTNLKIIVNEKLEDRRGRKLFNNDIIEINEVSFKITNDNK